MENHIHRSVCEFNNCFCKKYNRKTNYGRCKSCKHGGVWHKIIKKKCHKIIHVNNNTNTNNHYIINIYDTPRQFPE